MSATPFYRPVGGDATARGRQPQQEPRPLTLLPFRAPARSWLGRIHGPGAEAPGAPGSRSAARRSLSASWDRTLRGPWAGGGGGRAVRDARPSPGSASSRSAASAEGHRMAGECPRRPRPREAD